MSTFQVHIFSAECPFYEGECESLVIPTVQGQYGILAHHSNMICAVLPGCMSYRIPGGEVQLAAISEGIVKVEDNDVMVLADTIERPEEIDERHARRTADEAKEMMLQQRSIREYKAAEAAMARALSRLRVKHSFEDGMGYR